MTLKKITPGIAKKITDDWKELFPSLGVYKSMWLMNRVGPLLVGICLEKKSDLYKPIYHVHNLCSEFPVVSLTLAMEVQNQHVLANIHEKKYKEMARIIKEDLCLIPFEGDIDLTCIINGYRKYINNPVIPYQAQLYKDIILISAWCGNNTEVRKGFDLARKDMRVWPEFIQDKLGGTDNWLSLIEEQIEDRNKLIEVCDQQIINLKVDKIPTRTLII